MSNYKVDLEKLSANQLGDILDVKNDELEYLKLDLSSLKAKINVLVEYIFNVKQIHDKKLSTEFKAYSDTDSYTVDDKDLSSVMGLLENIITKCPNCKSKNFSHTKDRIECIRCGWVKVGRKGN